MIKHSYLSKKVKLVCSAIDRKGIFARKPIKKGEAISVWGGFIITEGDFRKLAKSQFKNIEDYATKVADGFYLVSCRSGKLEDDDFFNHSCNPNAGIKGHLMMVAMRDIAAGEEITYDYAMTDADFNYSFRCNCKAKSCRKVIKTTDWKNPSLQRKYKGYFSWYIQEKIKALKSAKRRK
ncbi:MAG: SET domain-containing protein-lysine N-methyltransferase [Candidatus Omnitrophica bacterium]|nr:SET domain-containing protein-lysine N-methyltransferase [Candidatus Omnitrophota bacterium]